MASPASLARLVILILLCALIPFTPRAAAPPAASAAAPLSAGKPARASSLWGTANHAAAMAFDGDNITRWGAAPDSRAGWVEVDLGRPTAVGHILIQEFKFPRTEQFAVQCADDPAGPWRAVATGAAIGGQKLIDLAPPVTARLFRLNVLRANEVPTIEEFQLYAPEAKVVLGPPPVITDPARGASTSAAGHERDPRLDWFRQAKFGFFINWGLYSIPAGEWKGKPIPGIGEWIMNRAKIPVREYEQLAKQFNPLQFDADEWVRLAAEAGTRYLVFDVKHHDGFALYRSAVSPYNVADATPWRRDPLRELADACRRHGLTLCIYYSQAQDWHEPNGAGNIWDFAPNEQKDFDQYLRDKSMPQVRELLTNYGPIGLIWFDTPVLMTAERAKKIADLVHSIQPDCLINSRLGPTDVDYLSRGDNEIPGAIVPGDWETPATINDTWGYKKDDENWKPAGDLIFKLVDIVSKGGNYLLNVGPTAEGLIPAPSAERLRAIGAWLRVNGEAIYGAGPTPFGKEVGAPIPGRVDSRGRQQYNPLQAWRCTTQPGCLYIHLFEWPGARFTLEGVNSKITKASILGDPARKLSIQRDGEKITISRLPATAPAVPVVLRLE